MTTGDVTLTKIGVYRDTTIAAGGTGQNLGGKQLSGSQLIYVPMGSGQVMILKQTCEGW